jgi:recombination protein RecR
VIIFGKALSKPFFLHILAFIPPDMAFSDDFFVDLHRKIDENKEPHTDKTMNRTYPSQLLERAVNEFAKLPGIGRKTAMRLVLYMLKQEADEVEAFGSALITLKHEVKYCKVCHNISDTDVCSLCSDGSRDASLVCVVENIQDVMAIENTHRYHGLYHVLGGVISPMDGVGPSDLEIASLVQRVQETEVSEVILALSPTMEGDTTNFFIFRKLADSNVKISVIARGISQNDELQYADEVTLGRSIENRTLFTDK